MKLYHLQLVKGIRIELELVLVSEQLMLQLSEVCSLNDLSFLNEILFMFSSEVSYLLVSKSKVHFG